MRGECPHRSAFFLERVAVPKLMWCRVDRCEVPALWIFVGAFVSATQSREQQRSCPISCAERLPCHLEMLPAPRAAAVLVPQCLGHGQARRLKCRCSACGAAVCRYVLRLRLLNCS